MTFSRTFGMGRARRLLGGAAFAALLVGVPRTASAQFGFGGDAGSTNNSGLGIQVSGVVYRFTPNDQPYNFRPANLNPNDINYQDCADNIYLEFTLVETGLPTTDTIQVWAGTTDCSQTAARMGATGGPYCWQVASPGQFAPSQTATGKIYVRNITQYIDITATPHFAAPLTVPGPEACRTQTTSGAVGVSLYFLWIANDGFTASSSTVYGQNVDMVGPTAPTLDLPIGIGDGLLLLNWNVPIDTTIQGFQIFAQDQGPGGLGIGSEGGASVTTSQIYCRAAAGQACPDASSSTVDGATVDATTSLDACTSTFSDGEAFNAIPDSSALSALSDADLAAMGCQRGGTVNSVTTQNGNSTCSSSALVNVFTTSVTQTVSADAGFAEGGTTITNSLDGGTSAGTASVGISQIDAAVYGAGNVGGNSTSSFNVQSIPYANGTTGPLINGHQYAIAIAAYDDDGNVGALSNIGCQTPEPIVDFWTKYKEDGGTSGGGFCSLEAAGAPVAGSVFGVGIGALVLALGRRRRRRNS